MQAAEYRDHIRADGVALLAAARPSLTGEVAGCPGWSVADLLHHMGQIHRWAGHMVRTNATERFNRKLLPPPPEGEACFEWFAEGVDELVSTLEKAGTDEPVWNWTRANLNSGWWHRRQAHETSVHRWDVAGGTIDPTLAADGIDELLDIFLPFAPEAPFDGTVHLVCADTGDEWVADGRTKSATRGDGDADVTVRGPASDLQLFIWNRVPADTLDIHGDAALLDQWRQHVRV